MPDFIVIGAVKAGTTFLHHYLGQHPGIQMSLQNWPRFFHIDNPPPNYDKRIRFFNIKAGIYSTMESGPYASTEKEVITN
jgi:hypothetical protein